MSTNMDEKPKATPKVERVRFRQVTREEERKVLGDAYPVWQAGEVCCVSHRASWRCTRPTGHPMPHAAHVSTHRISAVWIDNDEGEATRG